MKKFVYCVSDGSYLSNTHKVFAENEVNDIDKYIAKMIEKHYTCHVFEYVESFKANVEIQKYNIKESK